MNSPQGPPRAGSPVSLPSDWLLPHSLGQTPLLMAEAPKLGLQEKEPGRGWIPGLRAQRLPPNAPACQLQPRGGEGGWGERGCQAGLFTSASGTATLNN